MVPDLLDSILARYPSIVRPLSAPERLENAGGYSGARLWRYRCGRGTFVVRAWPVGGIDRDRLRRIHGWLARTRSLGFVPIPEPDLHGETIQQVGGRLWELTPWMPGSADLGRPPRPDRLAAGFAGLAALHQVLSWDSAVGPSASLRNRAAEVESLIDGGFEVLQNAVVRAAATDPGREPALRWLELARRLAPRYVADLAGAAFRSCPLHVCLRDARPDHLLFEGSRLTGLVDFGAMGIDLVEGDLARLLSEWVGTDPHARAEALAAYAAVRPLDAGHSSRIAIFDTTAALLGAGHWIRWHFVDGRVFDDPQAVLRGIERGLERLAGLAAEAIR